MKPDYAPKNYISLSRAVARLLRKKMQQAVPVKERKDHPVLKNLAFEVKG